MPPAYPTVASPLEVVCSSITGEENGNEALQQGSTARQPRQRLGRHLGACRRTVRRSLARSKSSVRQSRERRTAMKHFNKGRLLVSLVSVSALSSAHAAGLSDGR